jgi:glycine/D-amino acid oxidase-like deaminating enzyme/nitrite reductase/ring-hydroxylating ferredoxin subunit
MQTPDNHEGKTSFSDIYHSFWMEHVGEVNPYPILDSNIETDVVIIGGGLAGVSTAYCLSKAGKKIVLVEDGIIGSGETGHTTAHLVSALDDRYYHFEKLFGKEDTKLIMQSHQAAIDFVEQTVREENIDCQFERVPGYLFRHPTDNEDSLKEELEAAVSIGLTVKMLDRMPGILNENTPCLEFPGQAHFHPLRYLYALCNAIEKRGGKIFTNSHAAIINDTGIITDDGWIVKANHIVVATNTPVNDLVSMHLKQNAFRTYVIAGAVKKNILPHALWWDTGDHDIDSDFPPYHYIRLFPLNNDYDLLISGGEDHRTGDLPHDDNNEADRFQRVEAWTREHFPLEEITYRWSGQVMEPIDSLAFIGRNPFDKNNVYIITGDSGTGMTHCTIGGILVSDLILGKNNPWEKIYKPSRMTFSSSPVFFRSLMRGIKGLLRSTPEDERVKDIQDVPAGEGKICNIDGHRCGVYRGSNGEIQIVSTKCTHLGAALHWNEAEKTWDCPWHGSRFTPFGQVINGPANRDLPAVALSDDEIPLEQKR